MSNQCNPYKTGDIVKVTRRDMRKHFTDPDRVPVAGVSGLYAVCLQDSDGAVTTHHIADVAMVQRAPPEPPIPAPPEPLRVNRGDWVVIDRVQAAKVEGANVSGYLHLRYLSDNSVAVLPASRCDHWKPRLGEWVIFTNTLHVSMQVRHISNGVISGFTPNGTPCTVSENEPSLAPCKPTVSGPPANYKFRVGDLVRTGEHGRGEYIGQIVHLTSLGGVVQWYPPTTNHGYVYKSLSDLEHYVVHATERFRVGELVVHQDARWIVESMDAVQVTLSQPGVRNLVTGARNLITVFRSDVKLWLPANDFVSTRRMKFISVGPSTVYEAEGQLTTVATHELIRSLADEVLEDKYVASWQPQVGEWFRHIHGDAIWRIVGREGQDFVDEAGDIWPRDSMRPWAPEFGDMVRSIATGHSGMWKDGCFQDENSRDSIFILPTNHRVAGHFEPLSWEGRQWKEGDYFRDLACDDEPPGRVVKVEREDGEDGDPTYVITDQDGNETDTCDLVTWTPRLGDRVKMAGVLHGATFTVVGEWVTGGVRVDAPTGERSTLISYNPAYKLEPVLELPAAEKQAEAEAEVQEAWMGTTEYVLGDWVRFGADGKRAGKFLSYFDFGRSVLLATPSALGALEVPAHMCEPWAPRPSEGHYGHLRPALAKGTDFIARSPDTSAIDPDGILLAGDWVRHNGLLAQIACRTFAGGVLFHGGGSEPADPRLCDRWVPSAGERYVDRAGNALTRLGYESHQGFVHPLLDVAAQSFGGPALAPSPGFSPYRPTYTVTGQIFHISEKAPSAPTPNQDMPMTASNTPNIAPPTTARQRKALREQGIDVAKAMGLGVTLSMTNRVGDALLTAAKKAFTSPMAHAVLEDPAGAELVKGILALALYAGAENTNMPGGNFASAAARLQITRSTAELTDLFGDKLAAEFAVLVEIGKAYVEHERQMEARAAEALGRPAQQLPTGRSEGASAASSAEASVASR